MQTVKAQRTRLRWIMYQVGAYGVSPARYGSTTGYGSPRQTRYTERTASTGIVLVPWKHPSYWNPDGTPIPDDLWGT